MYRKGEQYLQYVIASMRCWSSWIEVSQELLINRGSVSVALYSSVYLVQSRQRWMLLSCRISTYLEWWSCPVWDAQLLLSFGNSYGSKNEQRSNRVFSEQQSCSYRVQHGTYTDRRGSRCHVQWPTHALARDLVFEYAGCDVCVYRLCVVWVSHGSLIVYNHSVCNGLGRMLLGDSRHTGILIYYPHRMIVSSMVAQTIIHRRRHSTNVKWLTRHRAGFRVWAHSGLWRTDPTSPWRGGSCIQL